jgi:hypothetical protein
MLYPQPLSVFGLSTGNADPTYRKLRSAGLAANRAEQQQRDSLYEMPSSVGCNSVAKEVLSSY